MSSNIVPLKLRPHLVCFLMKEMSGEERSFAGYRCKVFELSKYSTIGQFILDNLRKIDYPVKDIKRFNFFCDIKAVSRRRYIAQGKFYKIETLGRSFVELPEEYVGMVNDLFEQQFRSVFFGYVSCKADTDENISKAIIRFIEKYDLYEAGVSDVALRKLYYRIKESGVISPLQGKLSRK